MLKHAPHSLCAGCHLPINHKVYGGFIDGRFYYLCRPCHMKQTRDEMTADREKPRGSEATEAHGETVIERGCTTVKVRTR